MVRVRVRVRVRVMQGKRDGSKEGGYEGEVDMSKRIKGGCGVKGGGGGR